MTYQIIHVKGRETFEGTREEAIARALAIEAEYQPAYGVTVKSETGETLAEIRDGHVERAEA